MSGINTKHPISITWYVSLRNVDKYLAEMCTRNGCAQFLITFRPMPRVINDISIYILWSRVTQAYRALIHARGMAGITDNLLCSCGFVHILRCRVFAVVSRICG